MKDKRISTQAAALGRAYIELKIGKYGKRGLISPTVPGQRLVDARPCVSSLIGDTTLPPQF